MKRLLLLLLLFPATISAWQCYSFLENRYYTYPPCENVDVDEYHKLSSIVAVVYRELGNSHLPVAKRMTFVENYLIGLNTPTSVQLLADLWELMK